MTNPTNASPEQTEEGLAACPLCGSTDVWLHTEPDPELGDESYVRCGDCMMFGPPKPWPPEAIAAWNRRTPAPSPQPSPDGALRQFVIDLWRCRKNLYAALDVTDPPPMYTDQREAALQAVLVSAPPSSSQPIAETCSE
jgi:hypothetical protein